LKSEPYTQLSFSTGEGKKTQRRDFTLNCASTDWEKVQKGKSIVQLRGGRRPASPQIQKIKGKKGGGRFGERGDAESNFIDYYRNINILPREGNSIVKKSFLFEKNQKHRGQEGGKMK